jgi:hypothetical protein
MTRRAIDLLVRRGLGLTRLSDFQSRAAVVDELGSGLALLLCMREKEEM